MRAYKNLSIGVVICLSLFGADSQLRAQPALGQAAPWPTKLTADHGGPQPKIQTVTGGFTVNTASREEVRDFYNGIYPTSESVPQASTADAANCTPGHNASAFQQAELLRINWFRALAGMPATISLDPIDNWGAQQMAVIISQNGLNHDPPTSDTCYNAFAAGYAGGNQGIGFNGADCITGYIQDFGGSNAEVGHRRWILYPPETVMGLGDVPAEGSLPAANLTWVFDPASFGARPSTREPFVSWPPAGYVPYQVAFPYWSFSYPNADFSAATVSMRSNGVSVAVGSYNDINGYGDNTLCWVPMGVDTTCECTLFPYSGTDTVYGVTVTNVNVGGTNLAFSYNVIIFNPAQPGPDYIPTVLAGPGQITTGVGTVYSATPPNDPHVTSYNFMVAQLATGNLADNAGNGLTNFNLTPPPDYDPVTTEPFGAGSCFNLEHAGADASPQLFQLNEVLFPGANTMLSFESELGFASSNEVARVQASTDGGETWTDLFTEPGNNSFESSFTPHVISLAGFAGMATLLRFNFDYQGGVYSSGGFPLGWYFTDIIITNTQALLNQSTNNSTVTNLISGNLADSANHGLDNFTVTPPPYYYVITNPPVGSESNCFHLCHVDPASQLMQFNEVFLPGTNSTLTFSSQLGYATSDETALVQATTNNGATWDDLFTETGTGTPESTFTPHTLSLSQYAGQLTRLCFNFAFTGGNFYPQSDNYIGWNLEDILVTNIQQQAVTTIDTTNFTFTPPGAGNYVLQAQPVIFNQFPLAFGPIKQVTVVPSTNPVIVMTQPVLTNREVWLNFTVSRLTNATFHLLQATQLNSWTTNATAILTTNTQNSSYRFTTTNNSALRFYRVRSP